MYLQSDVPAMVYSVLSFRSDVVIKLTKTVVSKGSAKFVSSLALLYSGLYMVGRIQLCACLVWWFLIYLLLTELSRSVWENLDRGREYRPNAVRSVHTTEVKILPYRPTKLG